MESYWNVYYTLNTGLLATNTAVLVIQRILQYSSFITVRRRTAVIGCLGDADLLCDKAGMLDVTKERPSTKHK